jgi:malonyl-CoA/methylmalonyl-CoA synthetase
VVADREGAVTLLSIFANHAVGVPLCTTFPNHELRYIIDNAGALMLLSSEKFKEKATDIVERDTEGELTHKPLVDVEKIKEGDKSSGRITLEDVRDQDLDRGGMMLYTSGTTSRPKGVLLPQSVLTAQSRSLLQAWNYSSKDRLLHVLPLHHIHGTVNALLTPLYAGATVEFMFPFNATHVWQRFAAPFVKPSPTQNGDETNGKVQSQWKEPITFFTVVPTIYNRLLSTHDKLSTELKEATRTGISPKNLRLNISGSAALPTPTKKAWEELSDGNVLLERYGMTEVGMALSCGLDFSDRVDGSVGWALPGVQARLVDSDTNEVIQPGQELDKDGKERHGEIQLRGPSIFREYWQNAEATEKEFTADEDGRGRWFKTGDVAVRRLVEGAGDGKSGSWAKGPLYLIQGRKSADIIKTGGEKVSALEVEREMLSLPQIEECAVVALPSDAWGQKVAAVVVLTEQGKTGGKGGKAYGPMDLRRALKERIANYKIPQEMRLVEAIPRNAMGKINKKELVKSVFGYQLKN